MSRVIFTDRGMVEITEERRVTWLNGGMDITTGFIHLVGADSVPFTTRTTIPASQCPATEKVIVI